ncbi:hypothetical protein Acr_15g0011520 [Actinidia rufa]|uniref:Uncharacterized protein n=1 Tax=Actinidia rufa TaxID=165716 RepID=A0A7J0FVE1_9ERIC|nr:hypothetical protein Acr_15g0011520 [Actinidia rufa]
MRVLVVAWFLSSLIAGIIEEGKMRFRSEHCNIFEGDMRLGSQGWGARLFCNARKGKLWHLDTKKVMTSEKTALTATSWKGGVCILLNSKGGQCNLLNLWTPM